MERIPEFPSVGFPNDSNLIPYREDTICVITGLRDQAASASGNALLSELESRASALKGKMSRSVLLRLHITGLGAILITQLIGLFSTEKKLNQGGC